MPDSDSPSSSPPDAPGGVRVVAVGVVRRGEHLLLAAEPDARETSGWRPIGDVVVRGECAADTVRRAFREQLDAAVTVGERLGVVEHLPDDGPHEVLMVFDTTLVEPGLAAAETFLFPKDAANQRRGGWWTLWSPAREGTIRPDLLLELLDDAMTVRSLRDEGASRDPRSGLGLRQRAFRRFGSDYAIFYREPDLPLPWTHHHLAMLDKQGHYVALATATTYDAGVSCLTQHIQDVPLQVIDVLIQEARKGPEREHEELLEGCLLGCALGDSLGLPYEGASASQVAMLAPARLVQRFTPWGTGYASDDTEHTRMLLQCLRKDPEGGDVFEDAFRSELRSWFLQLPVGIGLGTARACLWNLLGFRNSGVDSAGNGPAMRASILGAWSQDPMWLDRVVERMTRITHTDPRAQQGARLVAGLAAVAVHRVPVAEDVRGLATGELAEALEPVLEGLAAGRTPQELTPEPSGFVLHTVPAVVAVVLTHPDDFEAAIETAVRLGGDTDTVAAIVGGIVGTRVGREGLPRDWLDGYGDWPWTLPKLHDLAHGRDASVAPVGLLKVVFMLPLALWHLFRRYATVLRRA